MIGCLPCAVRVSIITPRLPSPGFTRNIYLQSLRYNQHLCSHSLLIESGTQLNTVEEEYNAWHATEHVPQRLTVPGIRSASRYASPDPGLIRYFTWYALDGAHVLHSPEYLKLLDQPSPWSRRMRPRLRNLSRHVCETRMATAATPGRRIRVRLLGAGVSLRTAGEPTLSEGLLLGEVQCDVPPLPWAKPASDGVVAWVRLETLSDAFPSSYELIHHYSAN